MAQPVIRLRAVQVTFALGAVAIVGRAAQVQLLEGDRYAALAEAERTERVVLPARRGGIYDRNGAPFALTQEVYHVGVAPNELEDRAGATKELARQLGIPRRSVERALLRRYAYFHGPYAATVVQPLRAVRGVHLTSELRRFYPRSGLARAVLGQPSVDGRPASGIERVFDSLLTGVDGRAVVLRDGSGRRYESPARRDAFPVPGSDLFLTLDADVQEIVETALREAIQRYGARGGDAVVLRPATGEILAAASFDAEGVPSGAVFTSVFEPGSTAKVFTAAALLARGLAQPSDRVFAERGIYVVGTRSIRDEHASEWLTLRDVIVQSSNIGIVKFASRLSPPDQYMMLRDFGLGSPTGVEFPAESRGMLKRPHEWSGTTAASVAMGYEVAVTPLQLAQAYAAIAHDGVLMQPTLVSGVRAPDGRFIYRHRPAPVRRVIPPDVARSLRSMLAEVVYGGGTGATAALATYEVAGKTGTARRAGPGGYIPGSYIASFAAIFPAVGPQLVMVLKLDDPRGGYARLSAAPATRAVLEQLLASPGTALDRGRLARLPVAAEPDGGLSRPTVAEPRTRWATAWPPEPVEEVPDSVAAIPDVRGLSLRDAVARLHAAGFRVGVQGLGRIREMVPAAGSRLPLRSLVTVVAVREAGGR